MHFTLVDRVLEYSPTRIVTIKNVSAAEEYLQDHFPTFPVLPGVLMLEAMVQAARALTDREHPRAGLLVLGGVRALKYGRFVRPGASLRVIAELRKSTPDNTFDFDGEVVLLEPDGSDSGTAASGRFSLRPPVLAVAG